jgi:hypothetical protein
MGTTMVIFNNGGRFLLWKFGFFLDLCDENSVIYHHKVSEYSKQTYNTFSFGCHIDIA